MAARLEIKRLRRISPAPKRLPGLSPVVVLAEAAKLADERGFEQFSLAELADRLHVRSPSLYNHIKSFDSLKRGLAMMALRELADALGKAAIGKSRDEAVRSLAAAYREFVKKHPGLYQATERAVGAGDFELNRASDVVVNVCLAVLRGYGLDRRAALHALRGLRSAVHGFATLEAAGGFGIPLSIDESFTWLVECFVAGLNAAVDAREDRDAQKKTSRDQIGRAHV
jgi:AcrR family transcriptional regulator